MLNICQTLSNKIKLNTNTISIQLMSIISTQIIDKSSVSN